MSGDSRSIPKTISLKTPAWLFLAAQMVLAANGADPPPKAKEPDPRDLFKTVARARHQIASGEMEFEVAQYDFTRPLDGTNHVRLTVVFDGEKRRFESSNREYTLVLMGPEAGKFTDAKRRELGLDWEAAVRAGLLTGSEYHRVTAYDGAVLMEYLATDDQPFQTKIDDPGKGSSSYVFDPRALGLTPSPSVRDTVENCLARSHAESVQLTGQESVEGVVAWHVRVSDPKPGFTYDYWIDAHNPTRVVKQAFNGNTVFSKFDVANPDDPIPTEVRSVMFNGPDRARSDMHFLRRSARFNIPVDPASWTLAGLHMPVGTDVVDYRISRSIGWWNGSRLSDSPPPRTAQTKPKNPPNLSKLLELVEKDPKSLFAAHACFSVATLLKREANEGSNERATTEAERLFERVIADYGQVESGGVKLADLAKPELSELRRLGVGKVAQEIEGEDLDGRKMKLSDFRGKVVVLTFWGTWCPPCMEMVPDERKLVERMAGKAFAMIGINTDSDRIKVKAAMEKEQITWPSFRDGGVSGPIGTAWNVHNWPTVYVLDSKGVIRYRNVRGQALADAVDALIREGK